MLGHTYLNIHTNQRINQLIFKKDGDAIADGNAICKLDVDHDPCFVAVIICRFLHEASDLSTCRNFVDKYQLEWTGMTKLVLYHIPSGTGIHILFLLPVLFWGSPSDSRKQSIRPQPAVQNNDISAK